MSTTLNPEKIWKGTIIHSLSSLGELEIIENGGIGVDKSGKIAFVSRSNEEFQVAKERFGFEPSQVKELGKKFLIPGFVDTHAHAPQYAFAGTGTGIPLLEWLSKYTFKTEAKFSDVEFAKKIYPASIKRHLKYGSTTTTYYATIHLEASKVLADLCAEAGMRTFIGKVCMDRNSPDYYCEETKNSYLHTEQFIEYVKTHKGNSQGLLNPVVTPRFVPSCTPQLMQHLGQIAKKHDTLIQSHISENVSEVQWIKELHADCKHYTDVYDKYGLLGKKTVMAHAIHMDDDELGIFKQRGVSIAHCPLSNFTLYSGFMNTRHTLSQGVHVGLGTDVAGGFSPSMLCSIRNSINNSVHHSILSNREPLSYKEAFHLATVGGAQTLSIDDKIGNFMVGKEFDALEIDPYTKDTPFDIFGFEDTAEIFEKFIFLGDDRNIDNVFVKGERVGFK